MTEPTQSPDENRTVVIQSLSSSAGDQAWRISENNALPIGTLLGEFEIIGLIGEGGFGIVYLAYDHSLQRKVAVKEYMPSGIAARINGVTVAKSRQHKETFEVGLRSFINEARLLAQFDHPCLVKVHRFWEANGTAYMVMPFYEGETLKEALRQRCNVPDEDWLKQLLNHLLDALMVMHKESCFHRDIAPDNILILKDGRPLLLDFGAARRVINDMTQNLTVILKPGYAPIEQYAEVASMKQGPWTDIYALAAVVYFAVMGKPPIPAVARIISDSLVPLSETVAGQYTPAFLQGIDEALAVKPENRPQNIEEFRKLIGLVVAGLEEPTLETFRSAKKEQISPALGDSSPELIISKSNYPRVLYGVGVIIVLAAFIIGAWFLTQENPVPALTLPSPLPETRHDVIAVPEQHDSKYLQPDIKLPVVPQVPKVGKKEKSAASPIEKLISTGLVEGEACLDNKKFECAIAKAEMVLQLEPANVFALALRRSATVEQERAWETSELK